MSETRTLTLNAETDLIRQMKGTAVGFIPTEATAPYTLTHHASGMFTVSWPGGQSYYSLSGRTEAPV